MKNVHAFLAGLFACFLLTQPALSRSDLDGPPSAALLEDASWYAAQVGVDLDEAVRRLVLQRAAGALDATLAQEQPETYAGLWIEHDPEWRVVVRATDPEAPDRVSALVAGGPLAGQVAILPAKVPLVELKARQEASRQAALRARVPVDTEINVFENRVDVLTANEGALRRAMAAAHVALPERAVVVPVSGLAAPDVLRGGESGSGCTGGYIVRRSNGELGITTAAHCGNTQFFQGVSLPFRGEDQQGNQDVQWHSACDILDVTNEFNSGIGNRACTGIQLRSNQAIGAFVCKYGMTTGRTCGFIQSKSVSLSYVTSSASTFVRVDGTALRGPGDSGGPWFVEGLAYGTHSGYPTSDPNDAIYMPVEYVSSLGISVLTFDPGPGCNLKPVAQFDWTVSSTRVDFDASGSFDPDGSIVSYSWLFGDGSSTTTTSPFVTHFYSTQQTYSVRLTVTDNEGATGIDINVVSLCGSQRICEF